ncbi:unnamed protein product [Rodentolepis nana]|uniref:Protein kinase domain-containing protein n=1 Tax=Rodentolepis nana TaxID=102285 RepID=A0A0R3T3K0_RODNA|nr:unnamed protein product [Rodentolepis nana]
MGAKFSVPQFGLGNFDAFSHCSFQVHNFLRSRKNLTEVKSSTSNVAKSCDHQGPGDRVNILAGLKEATHPIPGGNEMSSSETNYSKTGISSTNRVVVSLLKSLKTLEIQDKVAQHEEIALERQEAQNYGLKCNAAGDSRANQVSFRSTLSLGEQSLLGFSTTQCGDVIYTAFIRMKNARVDEYEILKKTSARKIAGLERQLKCKIKMYEEAFKMRAQIVFKFEIQGSNYRDVLKCRTSLPNSITERLVSADSFLEEDVARGLAYIESRSFLHCDVASRNVLLFNPSTLHAAPYPVAKLGDFGLAFRLRPAATNGQHRQDYEAFDDDDNVSCDDNAVVFDGSQRMANNITRIPIKWTAPESIRTRRHTCTPGLFIIYSGVFELLLVSYWEANDWTKPWKTDFVQGIACISSTVREHTCALSDLSGLI